MFLSLAAAACGTPASDSGNAANAPAAPAADASSTDSSASDASAADPNAPSGEAPSSGNAGATGAPEPVGDANTRLVGEFETLDGATINLAEFHSEDLVLWMWAPW